MSIDRRSGGWIVYTSKRGMVYLSYRHESFSHATEMCKLGAEVKFWWGGGTNPWIRPSAHIANRRHPQCRYVFIIIIRGDVSD